MWPGASPLDVDEVVVSPLRAACAKLPSTHITSLAKEGVADLIIAFPPKTDRFEALRLVEACVENSKERFSDHVESSSVQLVAQHTSLRFWITSASQSLHELNGIYQMLVPALLDLPSITDVTACGELEPRVDVLIDSRRLEATGRSVTQVATAVRKASLEEDSRPPAVALGTRFSLEALEGAVVHVGGAERPWFVRDIARVTSVDRANCRAFANGATEGIEGRAILASGVSRAAARRELASVLSSVRARLPPDVTLRHSPSLGERHAVELELGVVRGKEEAARARLDSLLAGFAGSVLAIEPSSDHFLGPRVSTWWVAAQFTDDTAALAGVAAVDALAAGTDTLRVHDARAFRLPQVSTVQARLSFDGASSDALRAAERALALARAVEGVADAWLPDVDVASSEVQLKLKPSAASTMHDVSRAVRRLLYPVQLPNVLLGGGPKPEIARAFLRAGPAPDDIDALRNTRLVFGGVRMRLGDVVFIELDEPVLPVRRADGVRYLDLRLRVDQRSFSNTLRAVEKRWSDALKLPPRSRIDALQPRRLE